MNPTAIEQLTTAQKELVKLPLLGPALWLYARDPLRKFSFIADLDWRLMPALVLDQCKLYHKQALPWAFFTWARVNDAVHQRLLTRSAAIAPHEWNSGTHLWLIDVVMPFQADEALLKEVVKQILAESKDNGKGKDQAIDQATSQIINAWLTNASGQLALTQLNRP